MKRADRGRHQVRPHPAGGPAGGVSPGRRPAPRPARAGEGRGARAAAWFAALGEQLTDGDRADADAYARALGLGALVLGQARDWPEAERVLKAPDWSPAWWDREEAQRRRLCWPEPKRAIPSGRCGRRSPNSPPRLGDTRARQGRHRGGAHGRRPRRHSIHVAAERRRAGGLSTGAGAVSPKTPPRPSKASFVCSPRAAGRWASWALRWSSSERTLIAMTSYSGAGAHDRPAEAAVRQSLLRGVGQRTGPAVRPWAGRQSPELVAAGRALRAALHLRHLRPSRLRAVGSGAGRPRRAPTTPAISPR